MKAYLAIKYHSDHQNRNLIKKLKQALNLSGHESVCMTSDIEEFGQKAFDPKELMIKTFELIDECDFLLIEATEKGVGIGIEAGYSFAKEKPIIIAAKKDTDISTTLEGIATQIYYYDSLQELVKPLGDI